jgi:hypothetical protein
MDNDEIIISKAAATATSIDIKYKRASPTDKVILKSERDKAFSAYAGARLKLLEEGTISSNADVDEMNDIRKQVGNARKQQSLIIAIGRFVGFLIKFA